MKDKEYPHISEYAVMPEDKKTFYVFSGFMLIYVRSGKGTFILNDKEIAYHHGTTVILACSDYLCTKHSETSTQLTVLEFTEEAFSGRIAEFFSIRDLPLYTTFENNPDKPETILEIISAVSGTTLKNNDIFMRNLTKELLIYTIRNNNGRNPMPVNDIKTELAILYIYNNFKNSLSVEEVAAYVHYSANYFYHSFQKNTGTTFRKFLHNLRLDYAANLLRFTDLTISDVCYECGFNSVQYFSSTFRKKFGYSPKNFINNNI